MEFLNMTNATIQDKTILMLIERIENLEQELYETKKINIIRTITCCDSRVNLWADLFMFFLGIDVPSRINIYKDHKVTKNYIPSIIPQRAIELYKIHNSKNIPFWESDFSIEKNYNLYPNEDATNIYKILENMTLKELEDYWHYRLLWLKWLEL